MESTREQPARRSTVARPDAADAPDADAKRREEREAHDEANREKVEAMSNPEPPTPTQEEADQLKEGVAASPDAETDAQKLEREQERQRREVRPGAPAGGYQTR